METQSSFSGVLLDDLIFQILSWLPVISLLRFRCVSKSWKSLICGPTFVKLHLQNSPKHTNILLLSYPTPDEYICYGDGDRHVVPCSLDSLFNNPSATISEEGSFPLNSCCWVVGSCNGLVCIGDVDSDLDEFEYPFLFWNPATRVICKRSPPSLHVFSDIYEKFVPEFSFGYDISSDTYKLVSLLLGHQEETPVVVHNPGDNSWRYILSFPYFLLAEESEGLFLNGTLNWLALNNDFKFLIVSLDLGMETCKQLLLPDGLDEIKSFERSFGVLRDSLCLFYNCKRTHFIVWQMKEFGDEKSWTQLVNLSYQHLQIQMGDKLLLPLCTSENGNVVMLANNKDLEAILLYDRRDDSVQRIQTPNNMPWCAWNYVQSLVLPY